MNQYLIAILKEISTIIIPGIGALTITNAGTGEIMFLPYLKYDDGKLVKHISEKEGMSENDAQNLLAKYVREIEAQLNIGETYDLFQFGSFSKNKDGEIEFTSWNQTKTTIESNQPETVITETIIIENTKEVEPTAIEPEIKEEVIETVEIIPEAKEEIHDETVRPEQKTPAGWQGREITEEASTTEITAVEPTDKDVIIIPKIEAHSIPEKEVESTYTEAQQWEDDLEIPPLNVKKEISKKPILEKAKKDKKRKRPVFYFLLILGLLIVGGSVTLVVFYDSLEKLLFNTQTAKTEESIPKTSTKPKEVEKVVVPSPAGRRADASIKTVDPQENVIPETQTTESTTESDMLQTSTGEINRNKPFHLIGGAFTDKSNADRYLSKLIGDGKAALIIGKFDQLYIVSIASFSTNEEALNKLSEAQAISSKAWIFKFP